ncbi:MAG: Sec-independent protein translocase protein TatB [Proteobacteria bacterium]|nr:Sec-independent protein translocase protein TatB [Pseudomonadota bacterium]
MFDIGWQELFIIAVIAIIVIGPKDLPLAIRAISKGIRKARSMARDLQDGMDDVIREAELDDLKETISGDGMDIAKHIQDAADLDMEELDLDGDLRNEMIAAEEDFKSITSPDKAAPKKAETSKVSKGKATKAPAKKAKAKPTKSGKTKAAAKTKAKG